MANPLERPDNSGNSKSLALDADEKAAAMKEISSIVGALSWLHELIEKDQATVATRYNALGINRYGLKHLEEMLGAKDDLAQDKKRDKNLLREANMELHRLREEMGKGVTVEAIGSKLYQLNQTIYNWWQNLGFTYSKSTLNPYSTGASFQVEFSVNVERHVSSHDPKPVTAKARMESKKQALGKELEIIYDGDEPYVVDNQNNRLWIANKLKERFPKCSINKWDIRSVYRMDIFQISHVEVSIDMTDVGEYEKNEKYDR